MATGVSGRAGGIAAFARAEWRIRGRSHLMIAVLAAISALVFLATFLAAARSRTAFDRLRQATHASDLALPITDGDPRDSLETVRASRGVIEARAITELIVRPSGSDLFPGFTVLAIAPRLDEPTDRIDTPIITEGRAPRPGRADEVALSTDLAADLGLGPGDELPLESMTQEWVDVAFAGGDPGPADGPSPTMTVTGIARSPAEFVRQASVIHLTPAFVERHAGELLRFDRIHVRLDPAARQEFERRELIVLPGIVHEDSSFIDLGETEDGLNTVATALRLVGAVAAVAGALALALALARSSRASAPERSTLMALGWTRRDERRALVLAHAPAVAIGLAVGLTIGVRSSPWAMVDLARSIDPRPDAVLVDAQLLLLVVAGAVLVGASLLAVVIALVHWRPTPSARGGGRIPVGPPLALSLAIRNALSAPPHRGGRASRGAIAVVAGATAVGIASLVVSSSIGRLQDDASLTGERPERLIDAGTSIDVYDDVIERLARDPRVAAIAGQHIFAGTIPGPGDVLVLVHDPVQGRAELSVTAGRMPSAEDEVAVGPTTADATGAQIGEQLTVSGLSGSARFRVVGTVLFPEGDFRFDSGVALTVDGAQRVIGDPDQRAEIHQVFFDWSDGVDAEAADRELAADGITVLTVGTGYRVRPGTVSNLGAVEQPPRQLAVVVGLLALATVLHAVWVSVATRRRELVTMRALGVTRRATALLSATQVILIVVLGLLVGAPLGAALGRGVWRPIAEDAHLVVRPVLSWGWVGVLVGTAVLAGLAVASLAARWTRRLEPASDLRTE